MSEQHASGEVPAPVADASKQPSPTSSLTRKQRRIGERIAELGIFAIATVSIVAIFLIFVFVFREASPIFFGPDVISTAESTPGTPPAESNNTSDDYPILEHNSQVRVQHLWH